MLNEILIKKVRCEKWKDQVYVIFYRQGHLHEPMFTMSDFEAQKLARTLLDMEEKEE